MIDNNQVEIKLWTIQSPSAWSTLNEKGLLRADGRRADKNFQSAYRWMMQQMGERIPGYQGHYPIWCWLSPKPDLRRKALLLPGQKGIRIEFTTLKEKVLLSDFDSWHYVLNNQFLALTEDELFQIKDFMLHDNRRHQKAIEESWTRIFDLELINLSPLTTPLVNIQGVVEEISLNQVISVQEFTAR